MQKWTHFVDGKANEGILEATIGAGCFEQPGLTLTTIQTNEEQVEATRSFMSASRQLRDAYDVAARSRAARGRAISRRRGPAADL